MTSWERASAKSAGPALNTSTSIPSGQQEKKSIVQVLEVINEVSSSTHAVFRCNVLNRGTSDASSLSSKKNYSLPKNTETNLVKTFSMVLLYDILRIGRRRLTLLMLCRECRCYASLFISDMVFQPASSLPVVVPSELHHHCSLVSKHLIWPVATHRIEPFNQGKEPEAWNKTLVMSLQGW